MPLSGQSQEAESPSGLELSAFEGLLQTQPQPLLVGGQAVNLWAQFFLHGSAELKQMQPFLSRDCDLLGTADLLLRLARNSDWRVTLSGQRRLPLLLEGIGPFGRVVGSPMRGSFSRSQPVYEGEEAFALKMEVHRCSACRLLTRGP